MLKLLAIKHPKVFPDTLMEVPEKPNVESMKLLAQATE